MAGYIMDLRKIVGHRTLMQVGASVIVEDPEGRILLEQRSDNHCWAYPGGSVELDEDVKCAAKRELFEETGIVAEELELFDVFPERIRISSIRTEMKYRMWILCFCANNSREN